MIRPDLGTMIAVLTTDADVPRAAAAAAADAAAARVFNRITVDGSESTSDSCSCSPAAPPAWRSASRTAGAFGEALSGVCQDLALAIVADGEGARRSRATRCPARARADEAGGGAARGRGPARPLRALRRRPQLGPHRSRARRRRRRPRPRPAGHRPRRRAAGDGAASPGAAEGAAGEAASAPRGRRAHRPPAAGAGPRSSRAPTSRPEYVLKTRSTPPDAPVVAKLGGNALGSLPDALALGAGGRQLVIVHGGGAQITALMRRRGIEPRFVGGRRFTDLPSWPACARRWRDVSDELADGDRATAGARARAAAPRRGAGRRAPARARPGRAHRARSRPRRCEAAWAARRRAADRPAGARRLGRALPQRQRRRRRRRGGGSGRRRRARVPVRRARRAGRGRQR